MGRTPRLAKLVLDIQDGSKLAAVANSRTEGQARVERAMMLLAYADGAGVTAMATTFNTDRPKL